VYRVLYLRQGNIIKHLIASLAISFQPAFCNSQPVFSQIKSKTERYLSSLEKGVVIKGSMYLDDHFRMGQVVYYDNTKTIHTCLRYNVFYDQMEMLSGDDTTQIRFHSDIQSIIIDSDTFVLISYIQKGKKKNGYFQQLYSEPNCQLFIRRNALFVPYNPPYTKLHSGNEYDTFVLFEDVYFRSNNDDFAVKIKRNSRHLSQIIRQDIKEFNRIKRKNRINLKNNDELVKMMILLQRKSPQLRN